MSDVDIFRFDDYHAFLKAWFKARRGRPSMRTFAKRVPCAVATVSGVVNGSKKLSARFQGPFKANLKLSDEESDFFDLLVEAERNPSDHIQRLIEEKMHAVLAFRTSHHVVESTYRAFGGWLAAAVAELASLPDFRDDTAWVQARLRWPAADEEVSATLASLFELGRLKRVGDDVVAADVPWVTQHEATSEQLGLALRTYHQEMLDLARDAISQVSQHERHVTGLTVPVRASLLPELKQRIAEFQEEVIELCRRDAREAAPDAVYQLGVQLFPLTDVEAEQERAAK